MPFIEREHRVESREVKRAKGLWCLDAQTIGLFRLRRYAACVGRGARGARAAGNGTDAARGPMAMRIASNRHGFAPR